LEPASPATAESERLKMLKDREKSFIGFFGNTSQQNPNESPQLGGGGINSGSNNTGTINRPGRVTNPNQVKTSPL